MRALRALLLALLAAAGALYLGLNYAITVAEHPTVAMLLFSIAPVGLLALASAWAARPRALGLGLWLLGAAAVLWQLEALRVHTAWLYFLQHASAMSLLGLNFGRTLGAGDANALCSRITLLMTSTPPDAAYLRYTWKVTLAWTLYFAASALLSVLLFFAAPIEAWSVFANLLTPFFIGAMFVVEYLIRVRTMPQRVHFSIAETVRAYRRHSEQGARPQ